MKRLMIAAFLLSASPVLAQAPAEPAAAPAPKYSIQTTKLGELADNPVTRPIFEKYFPEVLHHPQFEEGRDLTLPETVQYVPDIVTPPKLAAMDAELKALP
jgi:hypothetical protein